MKNGGAPLAVAILVSVCLGSYASDEGQAFAQTVAYGARKDWTIWSAVVVGKVFCDQCIQSKVFPFAHPMSSTSITLSLKSKFLFKAMYVVDPLFYKPSKPMEFCPRRGPSPGPPHGGITIPFPNRRPSTCSCLDWLRPDYKCYWPGDMSPWKTTVGSVFGRGAQKKYGNKTLAGGLLTGDELLRQAIAALLNSRTNEHFYMSPRGIKSKFSKALYGSWKEKSTQAKAFKDANDGYGRGTCLLVSCKW